MDTGDIVWGRKGSDAFHPIVYWGNHDKNFFVGIMLTTSPNHADNILMAEKHFNKKDSNGKKCKFCFNNTHFVDKKLIKKDEWGPFKKVGELTKEGIEFIESKISNKKPVFWEHYLN